jgi:hypothetical protein
MPKDKACAVRGCESDATTEDYCRYHYIKYWRLLKFKSEDMAKSELFDEIEVLAETYSKEDLEQIQLDLESPKTFNALFDDEDVNAEIEDFEETRKIVNSIKLDEE